MCLGGSVRVGLMPTRVGEILDPTAETVHARWPGPGPGPSPQPRATARARTCSEGLQRLHLRQEAQLLPPQGSRGLTLTFLPWSHHCLG